MFKFIPEYMNNYVVFEFLKSIPGFEMLRKRKKLNFFSRLWISCWRKTDFYGWKNVNMAQEYISTCKNAVNNMAALLKASGRPPVDVPGVDHHSLFNH